MFLLHCTNCTISYSWSECVGGIWITRNAEYKTHGGWCMLNTSHVCYSAGSNRHRCLRRVGDRRYSRVCHLAHTITTIKQASPPKFVERGCAPTIKFDFRRRPHGRPWRRPWRRPRAHGPGAEQTARSAKGTTLQLSLPATLPPIGITAVCVPGQDELNSSFRFVAGENAKARVGSSHGPGGGGGNNPPKNVPRPNLCSTHSGLLSSAPRSSSYLHAYVI